ncbi:MAG: hypothetical protein ABIT76_08700 [Chthoniobacterales bacterium]
MSHLKPPLPASALADIAREQTFRHEEPRGTNRGPLLKEIFAADNYTPGNRDESYPWCAAFVDFVVKTWIERGGDMDAELPRTAAAFGLIEWGRANAPGTLVFSTANPNFDPDKLWPQVGDIVVYNFSHCGIVSLIHPGARAFYAVEGNTDSAGSREGWEVCEKVRRFQDVRRWIRINPPKGTKAGGNI